MIQRGGVDHCTLDQGASLLTRNVLSSAVDSQSRIKGTTKSLQFSGLRHFSVNPSIFSLGACYQ